MRWAHHKDGARRVRRQFLRKFPLTMLQIPPHDNVVAKQAMTICRAKPSLRLPCTFFHPANRQEQDTPGAVVMTRKVTDSIQFNRRVVIP